MCLNCGFDRASEPVKFVLVHVVHLNVFFTAQEFMKMAELSLSQILFVSACALVGSMWPVLSSKREARLWPMLRMSPICGPDFPLLSIWSRSCGCRCLYVCDSIAIQ